MRRTYRYAATTKDAAQRRRWTFYEAIKSQVEQVVEETGAIPYDVPDAELGHKDGKCSFESILGKYGLTEPALLRLAKIVHAGQI